MMSVIFRILYSLISLSCGNKKAESIAKTLPYTIVDILNCAYKSAMFILKAVRSEIKNSFLLSAKLKEKAVDNKTSTAISYKFIAVGYIIFWLCFCFLGETAKAGLLTKRQIKGTQLPQVRLKSTHCSIKSPIISNISKSVADKSAITVL